MSSWSTVAPASAQASSSSSSRLSVRSASFAVPLVFLAADAGGPAQLLQLCRSSRLELQVHDRTAKPVPGLPLPPPSAAPSPRDSTCTVSPRNGPQAAAAAGGKPAPAAAAAAAAKQQGSATAAAAGAAAVPATAVMTVAPAATAAAAIDGGGQVFAVARLPMLELLRGGVSAKFVLPLQPGSTVRGAASLDWSSRPGNYTEVSGC